MTRRIVWTVMLVSGALWACKSQKPSEASGFLDIEITPTNPIVVAGKQLQLKARVLGPPGIPQGVTWRSELVEVATVDSKGLVTGVNEGVAPIRATWVEDTLAYRVVEVFVTAVPVVEGRGASVAVDTVMLQSVRANERLLRIDGDTREMTAGIRVSTVPGHGPAAFTRFPSIRDGLDRIR